MELRVIDFEVLTRNFQPYVDGYKNIESEKRKMLESVEPSRKEMQDIIKRSQSGLIVDEMSQKRDMEKFKQLQDTLMKSDNDFKAQLKDMSEELNTSVYNQLEVIVNEWANANSIDLVMGKMEVIFNTD
jgi:Skp family chaperone for outer membrane proteins